MDQKIIKYDKESQQDVIAVRCLAYCSLTLDAPLQIFLKLWALKRMQIVACSKSLQQKKMEIVGFPKRLKQRRMAIARFSSMLLGMSTESLKHYLACSLCERRDKTFDPSWSVSLYRIWLAGVEIVPRYPCSYNFAIQIERALRGGNLRHKKRMYKMYSSDRFLALFQQEYLMTLKVWLEVYSEITCIVLKTNASSLIGDETPSGLYHSWSARWGCSSSSSFLLLLVPLILTDLLQCSSQGLSPGSCTYSSCTFSAHAKQIKLSSCLLVLIRMIYPWSTRRMWNERGFNDAGYTPTWSHRHTPVTKLCISTVWTIRVNLVICSTSLV